MMAMGLILYFCDPSNLSVKQSTLFPGWVVLSYICLGMRVHRKQGKGSFSEPGVLNK